VPFYDDADLVEILIAHLAAPLTQENREAFRRAAEAALAQVPCAGEGSFYRAVAGLQRDYFTPPEDGHATRIRHARSKLTQAPPLEHGRDLRRTRRLQLMK
jgi:hypothetical protein